MKPFPRRPFAVIAALVLASCRLDGFMFNATKVSEPYDFSESIIPEDRYEPGGVFVEAADGTRIHLYFVRASGAEPDRAETTIFYCHGNRDNIGHYWPRVELFYEMGYSVLIFDYRGFGLSGGEPDEPGLYMDGEAALAYLLSRPDVDQGRIVFYGYSLGAAVCLELAVRHQDLPRALVLESAFRSVADLVSDGATVSLDASFVTDLRFDNISKIGSVACPVLLMHGLADDFLRPDYSRDLYDRAPEPKELWLVPGANHTTVPGEPGSERRREYFEHVTSFVDRYAGP